MPGQYGQPLPRPSSSRSLFFAPLAVVFTAHSIELPEPGKEARMAYFRFNASSHLHMAGVVLWSVLLFGCSTTGEGPATPTTPAAPASPQPAWTFASAKAQSNRDASNPAAGQWSRDINSKINEVMMTAVPPCARQAGGGDNLYVELVMRFGSNGQVLQVLTEEDNVFSRCMRERFRSLNAGSAPWEGYWYWMSLGNRPGETSPPPMPAGVLQVVPGSCKPSPAGSRDTATMELLEASPPQGTVATRQTIASVRLRYIVPDASQTRYKLAVGYETGREGVASIPTPIDFPFPGTCGPAGELTATVPLGIAWSMPGPPATVRFSLIILEGDFPANFKSVAHMNVIEYKTQ
jgi:hypothetical protein